MARAYELGLAGSISNYFDQFAHRTMYFQLFPFISLPN